MKKRKKKKRKGGGGMSGSPTHSHHTPSATGQCNSVRTQGNLRASSAGSEFE